MTKYLHTMIRVTFFKLLGLEEQKRFDNEGGRYTLVFLAAPGDEDAQVELTYNWPAEDGTPAEHYGEGRNFGHLAYRVSNIYDVCQRLMDAGVTINGQYLDRTVAGRSSGACRTLGFYAEHRRLVIPC